MKTRNLFHGMLVVALAAIAALPVSTTTVTPSAPVNRGTADIIRCVVLSGHSYCYKCDDDGHNCEL